MSTKKKKSPNIDIFKQELKCKDEKIEKLEKEILAQFAINLMLDNTIKQLQHEGHSYAKILTEKCDPADNKLTYTSIDNEKILKSIFIDESIKPSLCLKIIETLLPNRIIISPWAYRTSQEVDDTFKNSKQLMLLLTKVATLYLDSIRQGVEPSCFTKDQFSSHESETTTNNSTLAAQRIFPWNGKMITMHKHLKIGVANNEASTLRIYFEWIKEEDKILIGYCGKHPDLLSRS